MVTSLVPNRNPIRSVQALRVVLQLFNFRTQIISSVDGNISFKMFENISGLCGLCLLFLFAVVAGLVYEYILRFWFYFSDRNVKFVRGFPLLGSIFKSILGIEPAAIAHRRCYECFPAEKIIGIYELGGRPSFLIRDSDLIHQILVTDKDNFAGLTSFNNQYDFIAQTLFKTKWHDAGLNTDTILSDSQMNIMHSLMVKCSEQFIKTLKETDKIAKIFNSHDLLARYANDIIATAVLGIELNSMHDVDNEFFKASRSLIAFQHIDSLKFLAGLSFPSLLNLFNVPGTGDRNLDIIRQIVRRNHNNRNSEMSDMSTGVRKGQLSSEFDKTCEPIPSKFRFLYRQSKIDV